MTDDPCIAAPRDQSLTQILIVDDQPLVREALAFRISTRPDWRLCGETGRAEAALHLISQFHPDLVLVDIAISDGNGIDLIQQIHSRFSKVKMLVISGRRESPYAELALRSGARGYVHKRESVHKVMEAIDTVLKGEQFVSSDVSRRLFARALGSEVEPESSVSKLSPRELEIFQLIGEGMTSRAMAKKLNLSPHTIDTHRENIRRKLGAQTSAKLVRQAVMWVVENR